MSNSPTRPFGLFARCVAARGSATDSSCGRAPAATSTCGWATRLNSAQRDLYERAGRPAWATAQRAVGAKLCRVPFAVRGLANLPRDRPSILVSNHASYLDGVILVAALPLRYSFVAKRELREQFVPRVYPERLGAEFVERFAARQSAEDANRLAAAAARGRSLAFFPEGTFTRVPALVPFHLGAFAAAVRLRDLARAEILRHCGEPAVRLP